jgi:hypothetical protein
MTDLNGCNPRKVIVKGPYTFAIGDTSDLGEYIRGGIFTQVKMPKILQFVSYIPVSLACNSVFSLEILARVACSSRVLFDRLCQVR